MWSGWSLIIDSSIIMVHEERVKEAGLVEKDGEKGSGGKEGGTGENTEMR